MVPDKIELVEPGHVCQHSAFILETLDVRSLDGQRGKPLSFSPLTVGNQDQSVRVGKGKRLDEQGIGYAENGGGGANAESDDERGEHEQAFVPPQGTDPVADVPDEVVDPHPSDRPVKSFLMIDDVAE